MQPNDGRVGRRKDLMDAIITFLEPPRAQEMTEGRKLPEKRERCVFLKKRKRERAIRPDLHTRDEGHQKWHRVPRGSDFARKST